MSIPWIKIEATLPHKPEVMRMASNLGVSEFAIVGHLVAFWVWCDGNLKGQCPRFFGTVSGLDRIAGRDGFTQAMIEAEWLATDGQEFWIPNFDRHLDQSAKTRAFEAERKRRQRNSRDNVPDDAGHCPKKNGTRGEERREDKEKTHTPPGGESQKPTNTKDTGTPAHSEHEVEIPPRMQTPECAAAFENWCAYLESAGLHARNPRDNFHQAQALWRQANRIGPEKWPDCVEHSIANGYQSIIQRTEPAGGGGSKRKAAPETDPDFIKAVQVCREFPTGSDYDRQQREQILGESIMRVVRLVKSSRLADVNEFNHKQLAEEWRVTKDGLK